MASFHPRKRTEWCVSSAAQPARNRVFKSEPAARKYAAELQAAGLAGVRATARVTTAWLVRVRCKGAPDFSKTFDRKADAEAWARDKEGEIARRQFLDFRAADRTTLGELLLRYEGDHLAHRHRHHPDRCRARMLAKHPWAQIPLSTLARSDFASYRVARQKQVKGASVLKELELCSRVISHAEREWGIKLAENPASGRFVKRPKPQPGDVRDRRFLDDRSAAAPSLQSAPRSSSAGANPASPALAKVARTSKKDRPDGKVPWAVADWVVAWMQLPQNEEQALMRACRYPHWFQPVKADASRERLRERKWRAARAPRVKARDRHNGRLWAVVSFAVQTAMRRGELLKLLWQYVHLDRGYLDLPAHITKNGKPRLVPLTLRALRILRSQPRTDESVFPITEDTLDQAFASARRRSEALGLRLHDLRHEATSRLFERTNLRETEIGDMTGHTDPRMLQRYYNKRPDDFVERFHAAFVR
jgi:Phage integrase family